MTHERFNEIVNEEVERIKSVLIKKQQEYNLDEDRLSHFKHAAGAVSWSPEEALLGYATKHWVSLVDMINSKNKFSRDVYVEKVTDLCNYLILLLGLVEDDQLLKDFQGSTNIGLTPPVFKPIKPSAN